MQKGDRAMNNIVNIVKMDMAICRKSMLIMILSIVLFGIGCLFFLTPLLLGFFVVGATAVVSSVFSMESKSNMEFLYGCFPIKKWEHVVGRSLTCLIVLAIPSVISVLFVWIGMHTSLCRIEETRIIMETTENYQMLIIFAMIMLGLIGGANLLLASFAGKLESREIMEVLLLLFDAGIAGIILFVIQRTVFHGDYQEMLTVLGRIISSHEYISCLLFVCIGLVFLIICTIISIKGIQKKCTQKDV